MRSPESSNLAIFFDHIEPCQGLIQCSVQTQSKTKSASSDVLEDRPEHSIEALNLKTKTQDASAGVSEDVQCG